MVSVDAYNRSVKLGGLVSHGSHTECNPKMKIRNVDGCKGGTHREEIRYDYRIKTLPWESITVVAVEEVDDEL
ncbi:hypothetical protein HOLleu_35709 [Holothuria leucospilota]|uniref:Uncharacterized protein n=1 Tax=Holothuria leucospilota TaxID=206669 RepID=A0A9Q0YIU9_HOLLE|nr:hypothetical protein HOLleu_35709 [Holothuria leucospilota]